MMCMITCEACMCAGVYIATSYFCIIFYGAFDRLAQFGYPNKQAGENISLHIELHENVRKICAYRYPIVIVGAISSGVYVKKQRNVRAFLIDWIVHSHMNLV